MTNKFTSPPPDELTRAKLEVLLQTANRLYQEGGVGLKEDILDAYNEALSIFFDSFNNSILGVTYPVQAGLPADPVDYNVFSRAILYDLQILFSEIGAVDRLISTNFNTITALRDRLLAQSRRIASKTADYLLYADPNLGDGFFFGDSFNSARYLDLESDLVDDELCYLNQEEGVILLPLDGAPERVRISRYILNSPSNGELGNNHQLYVEPHNSLQALGDGEPDTWVEYERVTTGHSSTPLILDLTIVLSEPKIINHIHIVPVQFGTPSPVKITKLETSIDGKEFSSIKEEVPISDFFSEEEDETFELSGKTSKYSGEGYYSFLPRRTQYVHIVLEQRTPYAIDTTNGTRLRYAIGLKDINIYGRKFKPTGSIVSRRIAVNGDVTKVALWASENPIEISALADIRHDISYDDGATWLPIQPQNRDYVAYPEVLNFNNAENNSVATSGEINSIRHKIVIHRDADAFSGNVTLKKEKQSTIDLVPVTGLSPFNLTLQNEPISDTVHISIPVYGSFSCPRSRSSLSAQELSPPMDLDFIETVLSNTTIESVRFKLPYVNIEDLAHKVRVFVDGAQWSYSSITAASLASLTTNSRVYFLNQGGRELQFVYIDDEGNKYGKMPGGGAKIQICLDGDNPPLVRTDAGYTLQLIGSSDGFKKYVSIVTAMSLDDSFAMSEAVTGTVIAPGSSNKRSSSGSIETCVIPPTKYVINLNADTNQTWEKHENEVVRGVGGGTHTIMPILQIHKPDLSAHSETSWGTIPPVYDPDPDTFRIEEYLPTDPSSIIGEDSPSFDRYRQYSNKYKDSQGVTHTDTEAREDGYVAYVDGHSEFYSGEQKMGNRWTFDPYSGILYLSMSSRGDHRIVFKYHRRRFKTLIEEDWDYYRDPVTNKIDTSRIVLKPSAVRQFEVVRSLEEGTTSQELVYQTLQRHDWWTQRVVKGSIKLSSGILRGSSNIIIPPVEVKFVDGYSELQNAVNTNQMIMAETGYGLHTFSLDQIDATHVLSGDLTFNPVIEYPDPVRNSQFTAQVTDESEVSSAVGNWWVDSDATSSLYGKVVVNTGPSSDLRTHTVKYRVEDTTNGIDKKGLYSVDYNKGTIYFASPVSTGTRVTFNVTMYSAFYNFSEIVEEQNIKTIEEKAKRIELEVNYAEKFLKDVSPQYPRPRFVKVGYDFYLKSTESLKDLEPFFSPICKDIAVRAITKDLLGKL